MLLEVLLGRGDHLQSHELVPPLLEPADDIADEAALDAIGLDCDEAGGESEVSRPLNWMMCMQLVSTHVCSVDILDGVVDVLLGER